MMQILCHQVQETPLRFPQVEKSPRIHQNSTPILHPDTLEEIHRRIKIAWSHFYRSSIEGLQQIFSLAKYIA